MRIYYFLNRHSSDHRFSVIARFFSKRFSPSLPRSWKIFKDYKTINLDTDRIERSFRWNEKIEIVGKSNRNAKCVQTYILIHALVAFVKGTSVWIRTNSQRNNRFFWIFWNLDPHSVRPRQTEIIHHYWSTLFPRWEKALKARGQSTIPDNTG